MFVVGTLLSNLNTFFSPDLTIRVSCIDVIVTVNDGRRRVVLDKRLYLPLALHFDEVHFVVVGPPPDRQFAN